MIELNQTWPMPKKTLPIVIFGAGSIVKDAHLPAYTNSGFKVLGLYEEILRKDLLKIETGLKRVNDNYLVSLNTFQTVTVAADLASLMAENSNLFNEVMSIQVPELIPFENLQMQKEFEALTLQLSN